MALGVSGSAFVLALALAALAPGDAWAPGSAALADAPLVDGSRTLVTRTGLAVDTRDGVVVSTGDGGGAGAIAGLDDAPVRVRAATFRGIEGWEIGTAPGRPASYVDDDGVRLDDGMSDRLALRAWPAAALLFIAALEAHRRTRARPIGRARLVAPVLLLLAALALVAHLV